MSVRVDVVSPYGLANAGVRARAADFLDRLGVPWTLTSYFGGNAAGAREFLRSPHQAALGERRLRRLADRRPERLLLRREASPLSDGTLERRMLESASHGVYDLDDALYADVRGNLFERFFSKPRKAATATAAADVVITGNAYIADWASERASEVRIVPTCVDPERYARKASFEIGDAPQLVWLGTASGERYLELIGPALWRLNEELGATVTVIGAAQPSLGQLERIIERVPWTLEIGHGTLRDYDVGIMPLADTTYERGKCAYKLLEYGAAQLPSVASPVGVNQAIISASGLTGPRTVTDWYDALVDVLTAGADSRRRMAHDLRGVVERDYSFQRWVPAWRSAMHL